MYETIWLCIGMPIESRGIFTASIHVNIRIERPRGRVQSGILDQRPSHWYIAIKCAISLLLWDLSTLTMAYYMIYPLPFRIPHDQSLANVVLSVKRLHMTHLSVVYLVIFAMDYPFFLVQRQASAETDPRAMLPWRSHRPKSRANASPSAAAFVDFVGTGHL